MPVKGIKIKVDNKEENIFINVWKN